MAAGFPPTAFAANCTNWVTSGSECVTSCRRTQTGRKKRAIRRRLKNLPGRSVTLVEDETDLLLFPPLRAAWALRGQAASVPISGVNAKRVVFGVLNINTGNRLLWGPAAAPGRGFSGILGSGSLVLSWLARGHGPGRRFQPYRPRIGR